MYINDFLKNLTSSIISLNEDESASKAPAKRQKVQDDRPRKSPNKDIGKELDASVKKATQANNTSTASNPAEKNKRGVKASSTSRAANRINPLDRAASGDKVLVVNDTATSDEAQKIKDQTEAEKVNSADREKAKQSKAAFANPFGDFGSDEGTGAIAKKYINDIAPEDDLDFGANSKQKAKDKDTRANDLKYKAYYEEVSALRVGIQTTIDNVIKKAMDRGYTREEARLNISKDIPENIRRLKDRLEALTAAGPENFEGDDPGDGKRKVIGFKKEKIKQSPEVKAREKQKRELMLKNKESYDSLSDEEHDKSNNKDTGMARTMADLKKIHREVKSDSFPVTKENMNEYVYKAREGDEVASTLLYKKVAGLLVTIAKKYARGNPSKFEELFAEASQNFMHALDTYNESKGTFTSWLTTIADLHSKNLVKKLNGAIGLSANDYSSGFRDYLNAKQKFQSEGLTGVDLGQAICAELGIHWNEYDKLRQQEQVNAPASMNVHTSTEEGEGGEYGDSLSRSDLSGGDDTSIGIGNSPEEDIHNLEKEVAQGDSDTADEIFRRMINETELTGLERYIVYRLFDLDGAGYQTELTIHKNINAILEPHQRFGERKFKEVVDKSLRKLARYIASITHDEPEVELMNLKRIYRYRETAIKNAGSTQNVQGYTNNDQDDKDSTGVESASNADYTKWREIRKANKAKAQQSMARKKENADEYKNLRTGGLFD